MGVDLAPILPGLAASAAGIRRGVAQAGAAAEIVATPPPQLDAVAEAAGGTSGPPPAAPDLIDGIVGQMVALRFVQANTAAFRAGAEIYKAVTDLVR